MLAGLEEVSSGTITIGGQDVSHVPPKDRDIAMVFQNYALYPHMSVAENMSVVRVVGAVVGGVPGVAGVEPAGDGLLEAAIGDEGGGEAGDGYSGGGVGAAVEGVHETRVSAWPLSM